MSRGKKVLIVIAIIFFIIIGVVSYDISRRTTFPGSRPQLKERLNDKYAKDSVEQASDSLEDRNL